MSKFIVFPHQLFENTISLLKTYDQVVLFEEPIFFHDGQYRPFLTNKVKLAYLRACASFYFDFLIQTAKLSNVSYVKYEDIIKMSRAEYKRCLQHASCFEYHDKVLQNKLRDMGVSMNVIHDSPMFLATKEFMDAFFDKTKTNNILSQTQFYNAIKSALDILPDIKSTDKQNRRALPKLVSMRLSSDHSTYESKYHTAGKEFANHPLFKMHVGCADNVNMYPCTFEQAAKHLDNFLDDKFKNFGPYQDAISEKHTFLFHSGLSPAMNVGLLTPSHVVTRTLQHAKAHAIPMNSCEGFIRQIVGWRERCMYIYHYHHHELVNNNDFWQRKNRLSWPKWHSGKTGISLLDQEIKKALGTGYAHHIVRLMLFMNVMVLSQIRFEDVYKWFMEVCAIDAYDWVMVSNIGSMGYFNPRFMSKPYLASSNYLVKMSDYVLDKQQREQLDALFYGFLYDKKQILKVYGKTQANVYLRNLAFFENKTAPEQKAMLDLAKRTRKYLTQ
jgi:deoxyribodipyrimidine photolyase-related protein